MSDDYETHELELAFQAGAASRDAEVQHLQFALADTEALEIAAGEKIDQLRAELVKALAACKLKDEALKLIALDDCCTDPAPIAQKALTIQPDDSALMAWLGEPVARINCNGIVVIDHKEMLDGIEWLELYSPKGLK